MVNPRFIAHGIRGFSPAKRRDLHALRRQIYAQYHSCCGICQARGRLSCHEIWHYDDDQHVQTLQGFIALCEWCHHMKHLGLAGVLAGEGKLDYDRSSVPFPLH